MKKTLIALPSAAVLVLLVSLATLSGAPLFRYLATAITVFVGASLLAHLTGLRSPKSSGNNFRRNSLVGLLIPTLFIASIAGLIDWGRWGGLHTKDDIAMKLRGEQLALVSEPTARIATVWAGAPAYYSRRSMVDLLGKSDPVIASSSPRVSFYPGHNKWDYSYSIGVLQPDIVHQFWFDPPSDEQMIEWGYSRRCSADVAVSLELWILTGSEEVRHELLTDCETIVRR